MTAARPLALLSAALALIACGEEETAAEPEPRPVLSVVVEPQERGGQAFTGIIEPQFQTDLGFRLLGRVLARDVDIGDSVEKGQRLAAIDPVAQELAVRSARAELSNAAAQLETATATELRQRRLMEQNVVSAGRLRGGGAGARGSRRQRQPRPRQPGDRRRAARLHTDPCGLRRRW